MRLSYSLLLYHLFSGLGSPTEIGVVSEATGTYDSRQRQCG